MATPMSTPRQPFAELSGQRLQHLTSVKNRQNGLLSTPSNVKSPLSIMTKASPSPVSTSKKRTYDSSPAYSDGDSENVDPTIFLSPSKKTKGLSGSTILKPSTFSFSKPNPTMPSSLLRQSLATPRANISSPRTPATAPAGRSPPRKKLSPKRRISAPYTRIDPPSSHRKSKDAGIPFFSLEEALAGSLNKPVATVSSAAPAPAVVPKAESGMPKCWFFAIHEDTPDQEAENLMEHSTKVLDLSSDEEGAKRADRGKENVAPAGAQVVRREGKRMRRRRVKVDVMEEQGGERSPLSEVEREDFFPEGVRGDEVVVVGLEGVVEEKKEEVVVQAVQAVPAPVKGEMEDIVIFEDAE
ncbi:hypothetical protein KVT40_003894 [Elsinoe batatas]|uniref:Uncharacterized protein n=1 Tax=Elsinoe batatas TaxID=2601811 RepID=A0A8K0PFM2_9PEZI|nr:hypothetical protein KVT40_003894 [Elsinoe batatas]